MITDKDLPAVVSFHRSGTHWLCSLIYQWFYWGKLQDHKPVDSVLPFATWDDPHAQSYPWAPLFAGHIYDPESERAKALGRKVIYLYRDPKDVLASLWRLRLSEAIIGNKKHVKFAEFLKGEIAPDEQNPVPAGITVGELVLWSQERWTDDFDVCVILYRRLITQQENNRGVLELFLDMEAAPLRYPTDKRIGYVVPLGVNTNEKLWDDKEAQEYWGSIN